MNGKIKKKCFGNIREIRKERKRENVAYCANFP